MPGPFLPDLLDALGAVFSRPGHLPLERLQVASWMGETLRAELLALAKPRSEDLAVSFAGHFLHGREHPTLHLWEGAHRLGRLEDPALRSELEGLFAAMAYAPPDDLSPEHLSAQLGGLAWLLRDLAAAPEREGREAIQAGLDLVEAHTLPFLRGLLETPISDPYGAALRLAAESVQLVREGLRGWVVGVG